MHTFKEWLKNKNLSEDGMVNNPMTMQTNIASTLNANNANNTTFAQDPNAIANKFMQLVGNPLKKALSLTPEMKKLVAQNTLNPNKNKPTTIMPLQPQNSITPAGLNYN